MIYIKEFNINDVKIMNKSNGTIIKIHTKYNFPFTILRLYQVYGPNQKLDRLIPLTINNCLTILRQIIRINDN